MDRINPMIGPRPPNRATRSHPVASPNCDFSEIRIRGAQPSPVGDSHRKHARYIARKRHCSRICRSYHGLERNGIVDTPVPTETTDRCESVDYLSLGGSRQSGARPAWGKDAGQHQYCDSELDRVSSRHRACDHTAGTVNVEDYRQRGIGTARQVSRRPLDADRSDRRRDPAVPRCGTA